MRFLGYVVLICALGGAVGACGHTGAGHAGAPSAGPREVPGRHPAGTSRTATGPAPGESAAKSAAERARSDHEAAASHAVGVLHAWDRRRSRAWAAQDPGALAGLYVAGSTAGQRDVALLRRYVDRGVQVPRLRMQLLRAAVLVDRPRRVVVRVTERLAGTSARLGETAIRLPRDTAQVRVIELRRQAKQWRVASVSSVGS